MKRSFFISIFAALGFSLPIFAASPSSIIVNMVPEFPAPYQNVNISLNSYANDLDSVLISWLVNNKKVSEGIGRKSFSLEAPGAGSETLILVKISLPDGELEINIPIRPNNITLLWQATDSYVPPFYKGKALPSAESEIKVVAIPEIRSGNSFVNPKNMTYAWKMNYQNEQEASGYGKNFFVYVGDYLESASSVGVMATTLDQKYSVEGGVNVGTVEPKIVFYKRDQSMGTLWENTLKDNSRIEGDQTIEAAPYFISPKEILNPRLVWSWFINSTSVNVPSFRKNLIPLRAGESSGVSRLGLRIENKDKIFQTTNKEINIEF